MSSPASTPVEDTGPGTDDIQSLVADEMRAAIVRYLLDEGSATFDDLVEIGQEACSRGHPTDHDRVRAAICIEVDHLPALVEHGLVTVDDEMVSLEFLPGDVISALRSATS